MWPMYGDHMGWMWLWWILGLGLLAVVAWALVRAGSSSAMPPQEDSPETVLKRRYARGEIDREDYERRLSDLRK